MGAGHRLSVILTVAMLPACKASAQAPRPTDVPQEGGATAPWVPPCMGEFTKLREEVQKRGQAAKAVSERKSTREEMCRHITAYTVAEAEWLKFTEASVSNCGIPREVAQQLKQVHLNTEQTKEKVCAAAAPPPSLPGLQDWHDRRDMPRPHLRLLDHVVEPGPLEGEHR
jgi:hypothetical protein